MKFWTWITTHPYWSTLIAVGFIGGIILLVNYFSKDKPVKAPKTPVNPNPDVIPNQPVMAPVILTNARTGWTNTGTGGGMGGARVSGNVSH